MPLAAQILLVPPVIIIVYAISYRTGMALSFMAQNISHFCESPSDFAHFHASTWHDAQSCIRRHYIEELRPFDDIPAY